MNPHDHDHSSMHAMDDTFDAAASDSFTGFFAKLFNADFMPHGHCYFWRPEIVWLHVISDALITLSYYAIPIVLLYFIKKRRDFPFPWLLGMFGAFILLCGTTHLMAIVTLWEPMYRLDGVVKALTAGISLLTAIVLVPMVPQILSLRSPKELEAANLKLEDANERLKEIDRLKDNFFSNISHELRTPLTLILAPLESFLSQDFGALNTIQRKNLEIMHNNSIRLFQMVNSILDFAKITAEKIEVRREPTEVVALTQAIVNEFQTLGKQKDLAIQFISPVTSAVISIDRYMYERILFNLLSNAVKFTPKNGTVTVCLDFKDTKVRLSVSDTGIGISPADKASLFQRFKQIDASATRRFEGTGIGLALIKEFAFLLGGDIHVESEVGKGSTFTAELEAPPTSQLSVAAEMVSPLKSHFQKFTVSDVKNDPTTLAEVKKGTRKILIAEDNLELASYVKSLVDGMGETATLIAQNGEEALALTKEWLPDLVLSDVMMPKRDGYSLCKEIKSDPGTSSIPVILLTALTHRDALMKGWESGADEYLFKPFHSTELLTRIKSLLALVTERKQRQQESQRRQELEQFSYFASHDLKEPIRVITTFTELLQRRKSEHALEDMDQILEFIRDASIRMQHIIDDLITFSLIETKELSFEPIDSEGALKESLNNLAVTIGENQAKISYSNLPEVPFEKTQMVRLFQNLIANAIKYRSEAAPEIHIQAKKVGNEWVFSVKDNGIGFESKYSEHIFVIFKRLHSHSKYPGTGVGLAICKRIVSRHRGRIWAQSQPGQGTTFFFSIPALEKLQN